MKQSLFIAGFLAILSLACAQTLDARDQESGRNAEAAFMTPLDALGIQVIPEEAATTGKFNIAQECPPMTGDWGLFIDWECDSLEIIETWISFYGDGTFEDADGRGGTWSQDNYLVDWIYDTGAHYWGAMNPKGLSMEGEVTSASGLAGCWWADR